MTVEQLLGTISSYELSEWKEFFKFRDEEYKKELDQAQKK
jgi:hypothetical protein